MTDWKSSKLINWWVIGLVIGTILFGQIEFMIDVSQVDIYWVALIILSAASAVFLARESMRMIRLPEKDGELVLLAIGGVVLFSVSTIQTILIAPFILRVIESLQSSVS